MTNFVLLLLAIILLFRMRFILALTRRIRFGKSHVYNCQGRSVGTNPRALCTNPRALGKQEDATNLHLPLEQLLNEKQLEAVSCDLDYPILCKAGPGSGKTRVLTFRILHLIKAHRQHPSSVLALTFTNRAANEMRTRVKDLLGPENKIIPLVGTFHSFSARLLRTIGAPHIKNMVNVDETFTIYDQQDSLKLVKQLMKDKNIHMEEIKPARVLSAMNKLREKETMVFSTAATEGAYNDVPTKGSLNFKAADKILQEYMKSLKENNAIDFEGLLLHTYELLNTISEVREKAQTIWRHVLVDEYQDTNAVQYEIIKLLAPAEFFSSKSHEYSDLDPSGVVDEVHSSEITYRHHHPRRSLFAVGDVNQAIYSWRGARPSNMNSFASDYPSTRTYGLMENYRSTEPIIGVANLILGDEGSQSLESDNEVEPVRFVACLDDEEQANYVADTIEKLSSRQRSTAVMYRTNAQSRAFEEAFVRKGIKYEIKGASRFYERREIKDMLAFLRIFVNPNDKEALLRCMGDPAKGLGEKTRLAFFDKIQDIEYDESAGEAVTIVVPSYLEQLCALSKEFSNVKEGVGTPQTLINESMFTSREANVLVPFSEKIVKLLKVASSKELPKLLEEIQEEFLNKEYLMKISKDIDEAKDRTENILELIQVAVYKCAKRENEIKDEDNGDTKMNGIGAIQSEQITSFLEEASLFGDIDYDDMDEEKNVVCLLSIHASKGLEFDTVFLTGLEDGCLPILIQDKDENKEKFEEKLQEERRLAYVAVTRAERMLFLVRREFVPQYTKDGVKFHRKDTSRFLHPVFLSRRVEPKIKRMVKCLKTKAVAELYEEPSFPRVVTEGVLREMKMLGQKK